MTHFILFKILEEIKNNLSFDIIHLTKNDIKKLILIKFQII